jgi:hypothetical protein
MTKIETNRGQNHGSTTEITADIAVEIAAEIFEIFNLAFLRILF